MLLPMAKYSNAPRRSCLSQGGSQNTTLLRATRAVLALGIASMLGAHSASVTDFTWDNGSADFNWNTSSLNGSNTYSGTTTVNGGIFQLGDGTAGHDGTPTTSFISVGGAGMLCCNIAGTQTISYGITGSTGATLVENEAGTLTLNNTASLCELVGG